MALARKVLWVEDLDGAEKEMLDNAAAIGATVLCIRTTSKTLATSIAQYKANGLKVYGWRYPQTQDRGQAYNSNKNPPNNSFATTEAAYVVNTLIPAGLDGYIMDIESDNNKATPHPWLDWDRKDIDLKSLATSYANTLRQAADHCGRPFVLGFTSHANAFNNYQGTPWQPFIDVSDVLMPQTYWRFWNTDVTPAAPAPENGGTPQSAVAAGYTNYSQWKKPIIPIGGEMFVALKGEMTTFGQELSARGVTEGHFYTSTANINPDVLKDIKAL
jgi:hypothetical protein